MIIPCDPITSKEEYYQQMSRYTCNCFWDDPEMNKFKDENPHLFEPVVPLWIDPENNGAEQLEKCHAKRY